MAIDPYTLCPGGTGKKLKFCCSDLLGELDKIQRMLEGEQRAAALEHIESIQSKYPDRACLLSIKAMLEAQLGQDAKAEETLGTFMARFPDNPVALAEKATLLASKEGGASGIGPLQSSLEMCAEQIAPAVYDAIGMVAQALVADNQIIAGRAHLVLQLGIGGAKDQKPLQLLVRINGSPSVPLLAKQDMPLLPPPDDALWKASFNAAMEPALQGAWRKTARSLEELAARVGDWPAIWHNIAVLRAWLADNHAAVVALRKYAQQPIPLDDAVEAEALAESLDPDSTDTVDMLSIVYPVSDTEKLLSRLAVSPRAFEMPIDLSRMSTPEEPPPKGAWWLLDRAVPQSGKDISREQVPRVVGQVFLFGKQTDREARLELIGYRTDVEAARAVLGEVGADALGSPAGEEVTATLPALQHLLNWNWRLPDDTPPEKRTQLMNDERRDILFKRWPEIPQKLLQGKTPRQAAAEPAMKHRVLGAILVIQLATDQVTEAIDFNQLRRELGLPVAEPIDPTGIAPNDLPLVRLSRVEVKKLSDDALLDLYRRADHYRHVAALRHLAAEVISRPSLNSKIDKAEIYGLLAQIEPDFDRAIGYLDEARKAAEAGKVSTAPWDLAELAMRIARGEIAEADRLLNHIRNEHIREQGVAQALFQILLDAGIIGPDGKPTMPMPPRDSGGIVVPGGSAAEAGKIWTPGGEQTTGAKKSALWTPDME